MGTPGELSALLREGPVSTPEDPGRVIMRELVLDRVFAPGELKQVERIDRYRIVRHLGAGGMGSVWVAHDDRLGREVAIKLVQGARADAGAVERFGREAQALAALSHPNVVQVYGVGRHEGRVYMVMELVVGRSLTTWLQRPRPWREVVGVMVQVARGLAAAHAGGIVHRDLKPDNIVLDERGRARIIDFGLARMLDRQTTGEPELATPPSETSEPPRLGPLTRTGVAMGTPLYMAPEQRMGRAAPASDQFAFCVTLYEALYGVRPFEGDDHEALTAAICHGPRPAAVEGRDVPDWLHRVVERGLASDPAQRWPSMEAVAERLARGPSRSAGRGWMAIGAIGAIGAVVGMAVAMMPGRADPCASVGDELGSAWSEERRDSLRDAVSRVDAGTRGLEALEAWAAQWEQARVQACRDAGSDPAVGQARIACLRDAASELGARLDARPEDEAGQWLMRFDPSALPDLGGCATDGTPEAQGDPRARELLAQARGLQQADALTRAAAVAREAIARATDAGDRGREAAARLLLGQLLQSQEGFEAARGELLGAHGLAVELREDAIEFEATLAMVRLSSLTDHFDEAGTWLRHAEAVWERGGLSRRQRVELLRRQALLHRDRGGLDAAHAAAREAFDEATALGDAALVASVRSELAAIARKRGDLEDALEHYRQALAAEQQRLGERHSAVGSMLTNLGATERLLGRLDDARTHQEHALEILTAVHGERHGAVADVHTNLGLVAYDQHDVPRARRHYEEALEILADVHGGDDSKSAVVWANLGAVAYMEGDLEGCMRASKRALAGMQQDLGEGHIDTAPVLSNLGVLAYSQGRLEEAMDYLLRARRVLESAERADPVRFAEVDVNVGLIALENGDHDTARAQLRRGREIFAQEQGGNHPRVAIASNDLCIVELELHRYDAAAPECARAREVFASNGDAVGLANLAVAEARLALGQGRREQGLRGLHEALEALERELGPDHRELYDALFVYGRALARTGRASQAHPLLARAHAIATAEQDERHGSESGLWLARVQWQLGRRDQAKQTFEAAAALVEPDDAFQARASAWRARPRSLPPLTERVEASWP